MIHEGAETYEDLMLAGNLSQVLRAKTAEEMQKRWEENHPHPPILGVLIFGATGGVCYTINADVSYIFFAIAILLLSWFIISSSIRAANDMPKKLDMIERGEYPADCIELLAPRLRWWNQLIEPHRWARHSRIFELERRLEGRIIELSKTIAEDEAKAEEETNGSDSSKKTTPNRSRHHKTVSQPTNSRPEETDADQAEEPRETINNEMLPAEVIMNPLELAKTLPTLEKRLQYQDILYQIQNPILKNRANLVLLQAMLQRAQETTRILNKIKQLRVDLQTFPKTTLPKFVEDALATMEERRRLVGIIDQIDPSERINLISI